MRGPGPLTQSCSADFTNSAPLPSAPPFPVPRTQLPLHPAVRGRGLLHPVPTGPPPARATPKRRGRSPSKAPAEPPPAKARTQRDLALTANHRGVWDGTHLEQMETALKQMAALRDGRMEEVLRENEQLKMALKLQVRNARASIEI